MIMKILYVSENHSLENYGVTTVLSQLADSLSGSPAISGIQIAATSAEAVPQSPGVDVHLYPPARWARAWRWAPGLTGWLQKRILAYQPDVIHVHGIWYAAPWAALALAKKHQIPVIVSTHGMWENWLWEEQGWLKRLKYKVYFDCVLRDLMWVTANMHAITPVEKTSIRRLLPENPVTIIPNAIRVGELPPLGRPLQKTILFLGRIHPKKGVELLIRAFHQADLPREWQILIVGPEQVPAYAQMLKEEVVRLGLAERVRFAGAVFGEEKLELLRNAWVLVTPSYSEAIAMVNLEAGAAGLPSITTHPTGLADWEQGGGMLISPNVDELAVKLREAVGWSLAERMRRGEQSHRLVLERYSWEAVIPQWVDFYSRLSLSL